MFKKILDALAVLRGKSGGQPQLGGVGRMSPERLAEAKQCMERGNREAGEGKLDLAAGSFRAAVAANPESAEACNNLGLVLRTMGRHAEAEPLLKQAVSLSPGLANGHYNLGVLYGDAGRFADAVAPLQKTVEIDPGFEDAYRRLAVAFMRLGRFESEIDVITDALGHFGRGVDWLLMLGMAQMNAKRSDESIETYRSALALDPESEEALFVLGCLYGDEGRHKNNDEALACLERSSAMNPTRWLCFYNLGYQYNLRCLVREAEPHFRKAVELKADEAMPYSGLGVALSGQGRYEEAVACYRKALAINPAHDITATNLAMLLLLLGDYEEGLPMFERRLRASTYTQNLFEAKFRDEMLSALPCWNGEPVRGKSLLVWQDHGIGDSIMCFRFFASLRDAGFKRVSVTLTPGTKRMIEQLPWPIHTVDRTSKITPDGFDWQIPISSLPWALKVTPSSIPCHVPYLSVPSAMSGGWARRLADLDGLKVGLVWGGNGDYVKNAVRSVPLELFASMMALPGVAWVSLQKGEPVARLRELRLPVLDWMDDCHDMLDTAALIENLDLVISVDTSVAHLAGAMGKPVWLLNRFDSDWRWFLGRKASPWYPSMRIFRQPALCDWATVLDEVQAALKDCVRAWGALDAPLPGTDCCQFFMGEAEPPPDQGQMHQNQGDRYVAAAAFHDAAKSYRRALEVNPADDGVHVKLGCALEEAGDLDGAAASFREAVRINPKNPEANCNFGYTLQQAGDLDGALSLYRKALAENPRHAEANNLIGFVLQLQGNRAEALEHHTRAIEIKENFPSAQYNRAICLLQVGDFAKGWPAYEWRWKVKSFSSSLPAKDRRPLWLGDADVGGKSLLLFSEQGLGDTIQFCRYAPMVAALGARVTLAVPPALKTLAATLDGVELVISDGDPIPAHDFQCPLLSLPLAFGTRLESVPSHVPYLRADARRLEAWRGRVLFDGSLNVGIVWRGNPMYYRDRERSLGLQRLLSLARPGLRLCSLQKDLAQDERETLSQNPEILQLGAHLENFADTAALVELMDIIISVDTATAHLAGSLGKPVCLMLPSYADWRWMLERADSPWYPSATLFRQCRAGDWGGVLDALAQRLDAEIRRLDGHA